MAAAAMVARKDASRAKAFEYDSEGVKCVTADGRSVIAQQQPDDVVVHVVVRWGV